MPEAEKVQLKINCNMELKNADNLHIFKQVQSVPEDAQKPFESPWGKRLTEIDPMWRIEQLTRLFGPAGEGWYTEVTCLSQGLEDRQMEQADTWNRWQPSGTDDGRRALR